MTEQVAASWRTTLTYWKPPHIMLGPSISNALFRFSFVDRSPNYSPWAEVRQISLHHWEFRTVSLNDSGKIAPFTSITTFASREIAMEAADKYLTECGYTLLDKEREEKLRLLL